MFDSDSSLDCLLLKDLQPHKPQRSRSANLLKLTFGRLTPLGLVGTSKNGDAIWLCHCACKRFALFRASHLVKGRDTFCGRDRLPWLSCYKRVNHGYSNTPAYSRWADMMTRCYNPNWKQYADWGGRGITVCSSWHSFLNFLEDMGQPSDERPYLERRDNNQGYAPENCYWATKVEEARNTRSNRLVTIGPNTYCVAEWAERCGIRKSIVYERLYNGWTPEEALELVQRAKFLSAKTVYLTADSKTYPMGVWAKLRGLTKSAIRNRLAHGWTHEQALGFQKAPPRSRWSKRAR